MSWMKSGTKISRNGLSDEARSRYLQGIIGSIGQPITQIKKGWYFNRDTGIYFRITEVSEGAYLQQDAVNQDPCEYSRGTFYALSNHYYYFGENLPNDAELRETMFGDLVYFAKGVLQ